MLVDASWLGSCAWIAVAQVVVPRITADSLQALSLVVLRCFTAEYCWIIAEWCYAFNLSKFTKWCWLEGKDLAAVCLALKGFNCCWRRSPFWRDPRMRAGRGRLLLGDRWGQSRKQMLLETHASRVWGLCLHMFTPHHENGLIMSNPSKRSRSHLRYQKEIGVDSLDNYGSPRYEVREHRKFIEPHTVRGCKV